MSKLNFNDWVIKMTENTDDTKPQTVELHNVVRFKVIKIKRVVSNIGTDGKRKIGEIVYKGESLKVAYNDYDQVWYHMASK